MYYVVLLATPNGGRAYTPFDMGLSDEDCCFSKLLIRLSGITFGYFQDMMCPNFCYLNSVGPN